jgi:ABC-2 type transport system permease protein
MTTITRTEELKEKRPLQPIAATGWRGGFSNLLRKELGQWWGTKTWWVQLLIWVFILNGISTIVALTETFAPAALRQEVVQTFLALGVGAVGMGTVIVVQGAIVGEKQLGTAAWVMSKPTSRAAFILTKALSYMIGFWTMAIIVPSIIFVVMMRLVVPAPLALMPFLIGLAVWALTQVFYLMLTLMLGTLFNSRGPIAGIGIAFIMTGLLLKGFIPQAIMMFTPWYLPDISAGITLQMPLPDIWPIPLVATGCWIVLFTAVALWRFAREEF